ncbi:hypothetical protein AB0M38_26140 [Streptomyces sp. NPDC051742]|uniref:hypothetical protein n=1 Tax=unclassified Streptomyces TaxID=2593676 RepID=UPI00341D4473
MREASGASPVFRQRPPGQPWAAQDWEQLRELAVGRMQRSGLPDDVRLRWGRVALAAISGKHGEDGLSRQGMADAARARAYMILEFGVSDSDAVRDLSALCSDVLGCLGLSHEAAVRLAGEWRSLPREQMLRLRRIKNMLNALMPLRALLEGDDDPALRDVRAWLELVPRLP